MDGLLDYGAGIYAFNAAYVRPSLAAIRLIVDNGRAAHRQRHVGFGAAGGGDVGDSGPRGW